MTEVGKQQRQKLQKKQKDFVSFALLDSFVSLDLLIDLSIYKEESYLNRERMLHP
jgi:hypothetical protein